MTALFELCSPKLSGLDFIIPINFKGSLKAVKILVQPVHPLSDDRMFSLKQGIVETDGNLALDQHRRIPYFAQLVGDLQYCMNEQYHFPQFS